MSRLAAKPIEIPANTEVTVDGNDVKVKGAKGELSRTFDGSVVIKQEGNTLVLEPKNSGKHSQAMWGTTASHITNMLQGVNEPYQKKLIVDGVGFKADVQGNKLVMKLGFSHPVEMEVPEGLTATAENNEVTVVGVDKEQVGRFAADIRSKRKPEPYKGKGIRYDDEVIRRKQGKKAA